MVKRAKTVTLFRSLPSLESKICRRFCAGFDGLPDSYILQPPERALRCWRRPKLEYVRQLALKRKGNSLYRKHALRQMHCEYPVWRNGLDLWDWILRLASRDEVIDGLSRGPCLSGQVHSLIVMWAGDEESLGWPWEPFSNTCRNCFQKAIAKGRQKFGLTTWRITCDAFYDKFML